MVKSISEDIAKVRYRAILHVVIYILYNKIHIIYCYIMDLSGLYVSGKTIYTRPAVTDFRRPPNEIQYNARKPIAVGFIYDTYPWADHFGRSHT